VLDGRILFALLLYTKKNQKVIFNRMKPIVIELGLFSNLFNPDSAARCVFVTKEKSSETATNSYYIVYQIAALFGAQKRKDTRGLNHQL